MGYSVETPQWLQNAQWFVKLRWIAILLAALAIGFGIVFFHGKLPYVKLSFLVVFLILINIVYIITIKHRIRLNKKFNFQHLKLFLNIQVSVDFALLTAFLHYSGSIENPAIVFYIFHMVLSSILLPRLDSFLQTTFALCLFTLLLILEYQEILPHYTINQNLSGLFNTDIRYLVGAMGIFSITSYLVVFLTSYVTKQLREHELDLEKLNNELNEKDRIKNEYVLRLTHDIKSFVSGIKSNLEVINRKVHGEIPKEYDPFLKGTNKVIKNLSKFIKDLLQITRSKLMGDTEKEDVDISHLLNSVVEEMTPSAKKKNIHLDVQIEKGQKKLHVYALSIIELLNNLLSNAIKYSHNNSTIYIEAKAQNNYMAQFSISDEGVGIPADEMKKLFKEFYRASNVKKAFEGTGLGLSIVKQIVENHGGTIKVESVEDKWTTFHVILPYENQS